MNLEDDDYAQTKTTLVLALVQLMCSTHNNSRRPKFSRWVKPSRQSIKLNFDGSKLTSGLASYGFVISIGYGNCGYQSVMQGKATGLNKGVQRANELGFNSIETEGDNLYII